MSRKESFSILIIRVSSIGDVIHTLPAFFLLKKLYPDASISWLAQKKVASLLETQPFYKKVWVLHDRYLHIRHLYHTYKIVREIGSRKWDAILDFQGILKTSLLLPFFKGDKIGFSSLYVRQKGTTFFTNHHIQPHGENIVQKNLSLAASLPLRELAGQKNHLDEKYLNSSPSLSALTSDFLFHISQNEKTKVEEWLEKYVYGAFIILSPNTTWQSKLWPLEYWSTFITLFKKQFPSLSIIILGTHFGVPASTLAQVHAVEIVVPPLWNLVTLTYLISKTTLLIAPDTGLLHLADFLGAPTIGIFGPTHAHKHGPFISGANKNNAIQIDCPHVYQKHHANQPCMHTLTPEQLYLHAANLVIYQEQKL